VGVRNLLDQGPPRIYDSFFSYADPHYDRLRNLRLCDDRLAARCLVATRAIPHRAEAYGAQADICERRTLHRRTQDSAEARCGGKGEGSVAVNYADAFLNPLTFRSLNWLSAWTVMT